MGGTIIVGIGHEEAESDAIALASRLARATDAQLLLAAVYASAVGGGAANYERAARARAEHCVENARATVPGDVAAATTTVMSTSPVRGLHELAERESAASIVVGPTHLGTATRAARGDLTLGLFHAAPCAVAIAPAGYGSKSSAAPRVVGAAFVDTPEGREALAEAAALAGRMGAGLRILHVVDAPTIELLAEHRETANRQLDEARSDAERVVSASATLLEGDAAEQLIAASEDLDLLVAGSRGYGPRGRLLVGSVSSRIAHEAACPLLVVPRGVHAPVAA